MNKKHILAIFIVSSLTRGFVFANNPSGNSLNQPLVSGVSTREKASLLSKIKQSRFAKGLSRCWNSEPTQRIGEFTAKFGASVITQVYLPGSAPNVVAQHQMSEFISKHMHKINFLIKSSVLIGASAGLYYLDHIIADHLGLSLHLAIPPAVALVTTVGNLFKSTPFYQRVRNCIKTKSTKPLDHLNEVHEYNLEEQVEKLKSDLEELKSRLESRGIELPEIIIEPADEPTVLPQTPARGANNDAQAGETPEKK